MSPRKILIFSMAYLPFIGGAEVSIKEITDRLAGDFQFDLIAARLKKGLPDVEKIGAVTIYRLGIGVPIIDKLFLPFQGAILTLALNRRNHYEAFWCVMASFAAGAAYIANFFQKKVPIILTLQEGDSEKHLRYRWLGLLDLSWRLALKRTDILTGLSNYLLERARRLGYRGESFLIPNGVDVKKFENSNYQFKNSTDTLITTSRLVKKNAVGDIIEALKFLAQNIKLKVIGIGRLESKLRAQVKKLGLENRVEFVGAIPNAELPKYLHEADIFIRPSLSEGQGISFLEAMAAGLPVIATPVGGIPDFLKDGETGLFCEVNNPASIAKQVKRLIEDENLRQSLIANSKNLVKEKYDWDFIVDEMKTKVFDKV